MNDAETYRALVAQYFGTEASSKSKTDETNVVLASLNGPDDDNAFRHNFAGRLQRLSTLYPPGDLSRTPLLRGVNELATRKNWEGAYAELAAYDYFHGQNHWIAPPFALDRSIDGSRTFTGELGKKGPANLDIHFTTLDIYADVKCLKDNVADALDGVYAEAFPDQIARPDIVAQHPKDMAYEELIAHRKVVINELVNATSGGQQPTFVKSKAVPNLEFALKWGPGTLVTRSGYSAYRHAEHTHQLVFRYARKFLRDRPSFITLVNFPWFNQTTSHFRGANVTYYRSFARRVFCQYRHDARLFRDIAPKFAGSETIYEVTRKVSALLFLEDHLYRDPSENEDDVNGVHGFLFVNPNADHHLRSAAYPADYFGGLRSTALDTFEHDNY